MAQILVLVSLRGERLERGMKNLESKAQLHLSGMELEF